MPSRAALRKHRTRTSATQRPSSGPRARRAAQTPQIRQQRTRRAHVRVGSRVCSQRLPARQQRGAVRRCACASPRIRPSSERSSARGPLSWQRTPDPPAGAVFALSPGRRRCVRCARPAQLCPRRTRAGHRDDARRRTCTLSWSWLRGALRVGGQACRTRFSLRAAPTRRRYGEQSDLAHTRARAHLRPREVSSGHRACVIDATHLRREAVVRSGVDYRLHSGPDRRRCARLRVGRSINRAPR
jgi:hypothetical protein